MNKKCNYCNETFKVPRRDSKYCSVSCRNKAYYDRRAAADPLYSKGVYEKRQLSIQKENEAWERRNQERRERLRKEEEQRALEMEESRKMAIQQEQKRRDLEIYNQRIKEEKEAEERKAAEAEFARVKKTGKERQKKKSKRKLKLLSTWFLWRLIFLVKNKKVWHLYHTFRHFVKVRIFFLV